jgi:glycerol-3-phosphate dehydrogenase
LIPKTKDGRVLFMLNWKNHWIAGTTDKQEPKTKLTSHVDWDNKGVKQISDELTNMFDVDSLEVQSRWAGHRPLIKAEGSSKELARTHVIEVDKHSGLISILGGKWTIYRKMGEEGVDMALVEMFRDGMITEKEFQEKQQVSTKNLRFLGDYRDKLFDLNQKQEKMNKLEYNKEALLRLKTEFPEIEFELTKYLYQNYGMRSEMILREIAKGGKKAQIFDEQSLLGYAEVEHLLKYEFCTQTMDILGRRNRLAFLNNEQARR